MKFLDLIRAKFGWLPKTEHGAYVMGARWAMAGRHIKDNPYRCFSVGYIMVGEACKHHQRYSDKELLGRAFNVGFGEVVFKRIRKEWLTRRAW